MPDGATFGFAHRSHCSVKESVTESALISIIVPVFNEQGCLADCLDSLLNLDYPVHQREIIVVDNNSSDNSAHIIKNYPVRYVFEPRRGAAAARNSGAAEARGDVLAFVDADCLVYEDWLKEICRVLANPSVDAVMGVSEGMAGNIWADFRQRQVENLLAEARAEAHNVSRATTTSFAIRKKVFMENGGFDASFFRAHDIEFSIRLHRRGCKIVLAPRVRVRHIHPTSLSEIEETRKLQGFFTYKIAKKFDTNLQKRYLPEFSRWYYRFILSKAGYWNKMLSVFAFSLQFLITLSAMLLESLHRFGFQQSLYPLFCFTIDANFLYGKILARLSEGNDAKIIPLASRITGKRHSIECQARE